MKLFHREVEEKPPRRKNIDRVPMEERWDYLLEMLRRLKFDGDHPSAWVKIRFSDYREAYQAQRTVYDARWALRRETGKKVEFKFQTRLHEAEPGWELFVRRIPTEPDYWQDPEAYEAWRQLVSIL